MLLLEQMSVLFLIMCVGYYSYRKGIITEEVNRKLSAIVVNIANPAMILNSGMSNEKIEGRELILMVVLAVLTYVVLILLAELLPRLLRVEKKSMGAYRAMTVFANIGFMGFPLISAVYGDGALLYASMYVIALNVLIYTYGIAVMKKNPKQEEAASSPMARLQKIFNIGVVACMISFTIYLTDVNVPAFLQKTAGQLGNLTAPLSMMVIGSSLATMKLKTLFTDRKLILFALIRLLLVPLAGVTLIQQFVENEIICGVCMVMLATPVASMTTMLAQQYDGDYEMTAKGVALTTILSVVTMPIVQGLLF